MEDLETMAKLRDSLNIENKDLSGRIDIARNSQSIKQPSSKRKGLKR
jgi:hypothetical protein